MYDSWFSYSITKPYPFRWFTPVTVAGGVILTIIFTLINLASSGFYLKTIYTDNPNGTMTTKTTWYMKPPFNWEGDLAVKCQPKFLSVGDRFFTSNLGLQYEVKSITIPKNDTQKPTSLPSVPYLNNTLENCFLTSSALNLQKADTASRATWWLSWVTSYTVAAASCIIMTEQGAVNLTLGVQYGGETDHIYDYVIEDNYTTHASAWWGTRLTNVYLAGVLATMSQIELSDSTYLAHGVITYTRNQSEENIRSSEFFSMGKWFITSDGFIDSSADLLTNTIEEGLHHVKLLHSLVSVDLGSCESPNLLLDKESLRYAISAPNDTNRQQGGLLYGAAEDMGAPQRFTSIPPPDEPTKLTLLNETYHDFTPIMGDLGCTNATIVSQYLCSVPQRKSTGTMLTAIVLANLVFLQAAWKILNLIAEGLLPSKDPRVNVCQGCSGALYQDTRMGRLSPSGKAKVDSVIMCGILPPFTAALSSFLKDCLSVISHCFNTAQSQNYFVMAEGQVDNLCKRCQGINLDHLFEPLLADDSEPFLVLDRIPEWAGASCPLCTFLLDMIPAERRDTCEALHILRKTRYLRNGSTNATPLEAPQTTARTTLDIQARMAGNSFETPPETGLYYGSFVNFSKAPETPVLVNHRKVDYTALREWYDRVRTIRRETMDTFPVSMIDCHARKIVPVNAPCDYIALSYVWGPTSAEPSQGNSLPTYLPRTVEDAITVVRELGLRYLWVDRYCLDQSKKAEFQTQLNQMADIYRHALMTIIGAAGSDADYGLPGVSSRTRIKQPRVKIGDYVLWSSMNDPRKVVQKSAWMTRAWTFQEGVFSWNWLAFTDEQVFFQRSNKEWANLERWWMVSCEMFPRGGLGADANCPLLRMFDNIWNNEGAIHHTLPMYTLRSLTYQSDALNGSLGLINRCGKGPYPLNHYFGTPILGPLVNHRKAFGRDSSRTWSLTEAFLVSLCWRSLQPGPRRPGFPSWSWTGWQTDYNPPEMVILHLGLFEKSLFDVKLQVQTTQGLVNWESMCNGRDWETYQDWSSIPQELYIQAPTVSLTVQRDPREFQKSFQGHAADQLPMRWCALLSDDECNALVEVRLVDEKVDAEIQRSGTVSLKAIVLRQVDPKRAVAEGFSYQENGVWFFAILVHEGEDGATRVGSLELRRDNYFVSWKNDVSHSDADEGKVWVNYEQKDYVDCAECRTAALENLGRGKKEVMIKVL
ncbi:heterokaryon incompatibility protein-domain-containing protein [Dactylonectria macrodidyma]|uniref:Heterokaryon incompatibility protein-domain-containing protein n=1 Tax=Dactylonectria macrodidyma TaxID=307937 RepID=A0A9P9DMH1_9HYPO|nr:heterokaryon incompatibility protein-domain-containing protein [Dactylonectria macrodidyma]